ncbi:hypothetical protein X777_16586 [Ooceraea biroi]|uniref:Uncharacterized protein n=1 Tax=Ooceraea biroi TaxID=2015173 RepID=A0A026VTY2_OOCBI|nr:hypothetical protein X777_16586 [Ooceraea biroi]
MWKNILVHQGATNVFKYPKKRNNLSSTSIYALCVVKSALRTRKETAVNIKIDEKHLSLMSIQKLII